MIYMKALKLTMFQETVCYKKPYAFKVTETYPLPPYSTVIGFLHRLINASEYNEMKVSVQGDHDGIFTVYNTTRFFHKDGITTMPLNVHMLYGVRLIIHIATEESLLNKIYKGFKDTKIAYTLGRGEDLVRLDDIRFVEIEEHEIDEDEDNYYLENSFYVPTDYETEMPGVGYKISKDYKIVNKLRRWNKVDVNYVEKGRRVESGRCLIDSDEDLVFLA